MGLAIMGCVVIFLTWLVNDTIEDPMRTYMLAALAIAWTVCWWHVLGPIAAKACRYVKQKFQRNKSND